MKDNMQNIADLIGALAEDIEEIKKTLASKETTDKDGTLKRLAVSLEPIVRFSMAVRLAISMIYSKARKASLPIRNHWAMK